MKQTLCTTAMAFALCGIGLSLPAFADNRDMDFIKGSGPAIGLKLDVKEVFYQPIIIDKGDYIPTVIDSKYGLMDPMFGPPPIHDLMMRDDGTRHMKQGSIGRGVSGGIIQAKNLITGAGSNLNGTDSARYVDKVLDQLRAGNYPLAIKIGLRLAEATETI